MYSSRDFSSMEIHFRGRESAGEERTRARVSIVTVDDTRRTSVMILSKHALTALELFFFFYSFTLRVRALSRTVIKRDCDGIITGALR